MATGIFALFDDIAALADDVALNTKIATQKTAGILGDDLAVNAKKATGFEQKRELIVIWQITKGSFINKLIILPFAFLLNYFAHWAVSLALICGGLYLLFEGAEKVASMLFHTGDEEHKNNLLKSTNKNVLEVEKKKIKSAVFTDFILSIEIVIMALSTVSNESLTVQIVATSITAFVATVGVYGVVALIVRLDNIGFWLIQKGYKSVGRGFVSFMPRLIDALGILGTIAMIFVGSEILQHNIPFLHQLLQLPVYEFVITFVFGLLMGFLALMFVKIYKHFT